LTVNGSIATLTSASASQTFATTAQEAPAPQVVWIFKNDGNASMTLTPSALNSPFSWLGGGCLNVAPGSSCGIYAQMGTGTVGSFSQSGIGVSGAAQGNRADLAVAGTVSTANTTLTANVSQLSFGTVAKGLSKQLTLTLTNSGG